MRIGIDGRALTGRYTGDRTYWLNLMRENLAAAESSEPGGEADHNYVVYTRLPVPQGTLPSSPRVTFRVTPAANDRIWTLLTFPQALREDRVDLAHTQYTTPLRPPCPVITTVHDISFRLYPEWFPRKHRMLLNLTVPGAMRRAASVITVSESSRRDILRVYGHPAEKVVAIPLAAAPTYAPVDPEFAWRRIKEQFGFDEPYVVNVGVLQPRKNIPMLVEAFARARMRTPLPHRLVLVGKRGWGCDDLARQAARLHIADRVMVTDYVADEDLPVLYTAADVMAYPSLYEGFGLPPLEAMACGTPTIVSDAPAMPEVVNGGGWVQPVMDAPAWGEALAQMLTDSAQRQEWREKALRRAAQFSWQRTAALTRATYWRVASGVQAGQPAL